MKKQIFSIFLFSLCFPMQSWPPALHNCGKTCFLNASIQAMYNITPLTNLLIQNTNPYNQSESPAAYYYTELIKKFVSTENSTAPVTFSCKEGVGLKELDLAAYQLMQAQACSQQDATEFIGKLIDTFIEKNTDLLMQSHIQALFQFNLISEIHCPALPDSDNPQEHQTFVSQKTDEDQTYLFIETENKQKQPLKTLQQCLDEYFKEETFGIEDAYRDPRTQQLRYDCSKQLFMQHSPEILIIALKRFRFISPTQSQKLGHQITIPLNLNTGQFIKNGILNSQEHQYDLIGAVVQGGGIKSGHYWAYVKNIEDQWYRCDDSSITEVLITNPSVKKDIEGSQTGATGYLFVYQKTTERQKLQQELKQKKQEAQALADLKNDLDNLSVQLLQLNQKLEKLVS